MNDLMTVWNSVSSLYQWLLATLAAIILGILVQKLFLREKRSLLVKQSQKAGDHSQSTQIGLIMKDKDSE